jgi:hypothetical protein
LAHWPWPDYYFRKGDLTKVSEMSQLMSLAMPKADAELIADLDATVAWAKAQGGDTSRLGIIGFCRGGRKVWLYSANSLVDPPAQRSIWPKSPTALAPEMKALCLVFTGRRPGHPGRTGRGDASGPRGSRQARAIQISPEKRRMASTRTIEPATARTPRRTPGAR